jgi:heptosyltransferase-2
VHPGSGSARKNWPYPNWAQLLTCLRDTTQLQFLLVGGEAEGDRAQRLAECLPSTRFQIAQNLPLVELALKLRRCSGFIGHDSGISHLAVALGVPSVILWGPTDPTVWCPLGDNVCLLFGGENLAGLAVQQVAETLKTRLALAMP